MSTSQFHEEGTTRTWQEDVIDALRSAEDRRVLLGTDATIWAVPSRSTPDSCHLVIAFSHEGHVLKVCTSPLEGWVEARWTAQERVLAYADARVEAVPDPMDEESFYYIIKSFGDTTCIAAPCKGYRFRDTCSHLALTPLDTIKGEE